VRLVIGIAGLLFCCVIGLVAAFVLDLFIAGMIIPDPCEYHSKETTWIFDLFYRKTSDEGYHPSPTTFNYVLTIALGLLLGIFINKQVVTAFNYQQKSI